MWGEISSDIVKCVVCGERLDQVRESWTQGARSVQTLLVWGQIRSDRVKRCRPPVAVMEIQVKSDNADQRRPEREVRSGQTLWAAAECVETSGQIRHC